MRGQLLLFVYISSCTDPYDGNYDFFVVDGVNDAIVTNSESVSIPTFKLRASWGSGITSKSVYSVLNGFPSGRVTALYLP